MGFHDSQVLFNKSLRYNIAYGKQEANDAEIFHAARSAALGEFVESLPEKLDTLVGERGLRLSGGERQRVGCARCIIKAPSIVLLDEASSALVCSTYTHSRCLTRKFPEGVVTSVTIAIYSPSPLF